MSLVTEGQSQFSGFALCLYYNADSGHVKTGCLSRGINNFQRFRKRVIFALSPDVFYALTSSLQSEKRSGKKVNGKPHTWSKKSAAFAGGKY